MFEIRPIARPITQKNSPALTGPSNTTTTDQMIHELAIALQTRYYAKARANLTLHIALSKASK